MTSNKKILTSMYCFSILLNAMTMIQQHEPGCNAYRLTIIALLVFVVSLVNSYRTNIKMKNVYGKLIP